MLTATLAVTMTLEVQILKPNRLLCPVLRCSARACAGTGIIVHIVSPCYGLPSLQYSMGCPD